MSSKPSLSSPEPAAVLGEKNSPTSGPRTWTGRNLGGGPAPETLKHLEREFGSSIRPFAADLSRQEERLKLSAVLQNEQPHLRYLVNCAGYAKFCSYEGSESTGFPGYLSLSYIDGVVAMGLHPAFHMRRGDHLINIASQAAFQPLPYPKSLQLYQGIRPPLFPCPEIRELKERGNRRHRCLSGMDGHSSLPKG